MPTYSEYIDYEDYRDHCGERLVQGYHYSDKTFEKRKLRKEKPSVPYFGVELETSTAEDSERIAFDYLSPLLDEGLANLERDSSIRDQGIEIIYNPFSYAYIQHNFFKLFGPPMEAFNAGLRSTPDHYCGMHISIGIEAFTTLSLFRLTNLIYRYPYLTAFLSRRKSAQQFSNWCSPRMDRRLLEGATDKNWKTKTLQRNCKEKHLYTGHENSLTLTDRKLEIRIFRGSLRESLLRYNLECAKALLDFSTNGYGKNAFDVTAKSFVDFVNSYPKQYPLVHKHLQRPKRTVAQFCKEVTESSICNETIKGILKDAETPTRKKRNNKGDK